MVYSRVLHMLYSFLLKTRYSLIYRTYPFIKTSSPFRRAILPIKNKPKRSIIIIRSTLNLHCLNSLQEQFCLISEMSIKQINFNQAKPLATENKLLIKCQVVSTTVHRNQVVGPFYYYLMKQGHLTLFGK